METVAIFLANALGALLREVPGIVALIREHASLTDDGRALLDRIDARLAEHERRLDSIHPLPVPHAGSPTVDGEAPDPKPTRPG